MGKKKSVVLITLISIVVAFLCLLTMFPSFAIPFPVDGTYKTWNPVVNQFALSSDFGGGYYTYYYPQGVIPASEFENNYENISDETEKEEYKNSYVAWKGLYLEKAETSIFDDEDTASAANISDEFKIQFSKAAQLVMSRVEKKGYSASRVAVVDDYALRVELPVSEVNFSTAFQTYANVGKLELQMGGVVLEELEETDITKYIKSFNVRTQYGQVVYVEIKLTKEGKELFKGLKSELTASSEGSTSATTLDITLGGETTLQIYSDFVSDDGDTWLSFLSDLVANAKFQYSLDEMSRILFSPKQDTASLQPVWTYDDGNSSILQPSITLNHDIYGIPNVVEVIYSNGGTFYHAKAINDDPNSPISTVNRGRTITHRVTDPEIIGNPTQEQIDEYAERTLREMSALEYTISYTHGYCPVRIGDCVRLNYERAGLRNVKAKVIKQTIDCTTSCQVSETAVYTRKLWG